MEAALFPLSEMLKDLQHHLDTLIAVSHWDVRHHIALDVAAGVEALHSSEIIHGDIKPANVLVFRQDNPSVPFLAKLSDFGVCIDMSDHKISARDYYGTPKWVGPEAIDHDLAYDAGWRRSQTWSRPRESQRRKYSVLYSALVEGCRIPSG